MGDFMRNKYFIRLLMLALVLSAIPAIAPTASGQVAVGISVGFAPPAIPVYEQPICPGDGYIWTPGYWGWGSGAYLWHGGYWGEHVGFYGGINYGFVYGGFGYDGGRWD